VSNIRISGKKDNEFLRKGKDTWTKMILVFKKWFRWFFGGKVTLFENGTPPLFPPDSPSLISGRGTEGGPEWNAFCILRK